MDLVLEIDFAAQTDFAVQALAQAVTYIQQTQQRYPHPASPSPLHVVAPSVVAAKARAILGQDPLFLDHETTGLRKSVQVEEIGDEYRTAGTARYLHCTNRVRPCRGE